MSDTADGPQRGQKRTGSHVSRACDACRKRKMKCDGIRPQCTVCIERGCACEYNDDDKRKTNMEQMEEMRARISKLESMIERFIRGATDIHQPGAHLSPPPADTSRDIRPLPNRSSTLISPATAFGREPLTQEITPRHQTTPSRFGDVDYERLQRVEAAAGALVQHGPTSLWTYKAPRPDPIGSPVRELEPGDWVDWARHLPSTLNIDRSTHDRALEFFAAYYAPWCYNVDMSAFQTDLIVCNLVRAGDRGKPSRPKRTAHYSPLLHNCALFLGLHITRHEYPNMSGRFESLFMQHCSALLLEECDNTSLSSLRAYSLFANCAHFVRMSTHDNHSELKDRQYTTGYIYSGQAIAGVHAMGLNINSDHHVGRGLITLKEQNLRDYVYWTVYCQDTIRAFAAGRQPMLLEIIGLRSPAIDPLIDNLPWFAPTRLDNLNTASLNGSKSHYSTTFHWTARLIVLCRTIMDNLYSPWSRATRSEQTLHEVSHQLDSWYSQFPLSPAHRFPLPHILLLHMIYHLMVIFVHRPFYRSSSVSSAGKCDQAALSILQLLQLFDHTHGIRFCHHNLINVIFGAATVFLLRCAGSPREDPSYAIDSQHFDECLDYMERLGQTWMEAGKGRSILVSLQAEYCPNVEVLDNCDSTNAATGQLDNAQDWLAGQDFWGMLFPEQSLFDPFDLMDAGLD